MRFLGFLDLPLDDSNVWHQFGFSLLVWGVAAALIVYVLAPLMVWLARRTPTDWDSKALQAVRVPFMLIVLTKGLADSLAILAEGNTLSNNAVDNLVIALEIVIVIGSAWLFFRLYKRVAMPFLKNLATHTETKLDDVMLPLLDKLGAVVIVVFAGTAIMDKMGLNPGVALAGMGVAGLVIAFAAQDTLSNFFSGLHLMLDRPFEVGDTILLDEKERADVLDIGLRSCKLFDRRMATLVVMPNNRIASSKITNLTKPDVYFRLKIYVGVAYNSDPEKVRDLLFKVASEFPHAIVDKEHPIRSRFEDFGDSALKFVLKVWIDDANQMNNYAAELRHEIYRRFKDNGIKIPFPQRVVHLRDKGQAADESSIVAE